MPFYDHPPFPLKHLQGDHPLHVGPLGYNGSKAAMEMISRADVVLALGTRCNGDATVKPAGIRNGGLFLNHPFLQRLKKKQHWNLQDFEISRIDFFMSSINSNAAKCLKSHWTNSDWCVVWYLSSFVQVESFLHLAMLWHWVLAKGCQAHPGADFTRPVDPVVI